MLLRVWSDLHLELSRNWSQTTKRLLAAPVPDNTILLLAGDIGNPFKRNYRKFLNAVAPRYRQVIITSGNHEYYQIDNPYHDPAVGLFDTKRHSGMSSVDRQLHNLASKFSNVAYLNQGSLIVDRVRFLGCTLWSRSDPKLCHHLNDYTFIPAFTSHRCESLHTDHVAWLERKLAVPDESFDHTVVMTHHLPSYQLVAPKYAGDVLTPFYATNLDHLVSQADVWVCGHSHTAGMAVLGKCRLHLNPVGYESESSGYDPDLLIPVVR